AAVGVQESLPADAAPPALLLHEAERPTHQAEMPSSTLASSRAEPESTLEEALDGEYKQVTVLCAALAEAPMLAARLGPEAMHRLMARRAGPGQGYRAAL